LLGQVPEGFQGEDAFRRIQRRGLEHAEREIHHEQQTQTHPENSKRTQIHRQMLIQSVVNSFQ
jgi:hypothetical protein